MKAVQIGRLALAALALAGMSCGSAVRQGSGTSFLIIDSLTSSEGGGTLLSDVVRIVDGVPTHFNDVASVAFSLGLKDPGPAGNPTAPTQNQFITLDRYHVRYIRSDGRNTQGVDVPYAFDGSFTVTVGSGRQVSAFTLVRHIAKREAPLAALTVNGLVISTIAEVTFYGRDQTGREVTATGRMSVDFGNFGDPA